MFETSLMGWAITPVVDYVLDQLKDVAEGAAKDWLGDRVAGWLSPDAARLAVKRAVTAFAQVFDQEVAGCESGYRLQHEIPTLLRRYLDVPEVRNELGRAFTRSQGDTSPTDPGLLRDAWQRTVLLELPGDFYWSKLALRYDRLVRWIVAGDPGLARLHGNLDGAASFPGSSSAPPTTVLEGLALSLRARYGSLRMEILDGSPDHAPVSLQDVFIEQSVRPIGRFHPRVEELPLEDRWADAAWPPQSVEEDEPDDGVGDELRQIEQERRRYFAQGLRAVGQVLEDKDLRLIVILGEPGAGKSSLLAWKALRWAESGLGRIPLLIELKAFAGALRRGSSNGFLQYLDQAPGITWRLPPLQVSSALKAGEACLLLDGLDEVFDPSTREQVANEIVRFSIEFARVRIVVTSRAAGYERTASALRRAGFQDWMLQALNAGQQARFIERWHRCAHADPAMAAAKAAALAAAVAGVPAIAEMAANPLLLTLLAVLNRHRELPRDRNALFERASALLLDQWEAGKALPPEATTDAGTDLADKQALLRAVAQRMFDDDLGNTIDEDALESIMRETLEQERDVNDARRVAAGLVASLRERSFVLCQSGPRRYSFVHRCFLEFFCASAWVWKYREAAEAQRIPLERLRQLTIDAHWDDDRWAEVLRLISARLPIEDGQRLLLGLLDQADGRGDGGPVWLAASCREALRLPARATALNARLASTLGQIAIQPPLQDMSSLLRVSPAALQARAVLALANLRRGEARMRDELKARVLSDAPLEVRAAAVRALARHWRGDAEAEALLNDRALHDDVPPLRLVALSAVLEGWRGSERARRTVLALAQDANWTVRKAAVVELAAWAHADEAVRQALRAAVLNDESEDVRRAAVQCVDPQGEALADAADLRAVACGDASADVRSAALRMAARRGADEVGLRQFVVDRFREDGATAVRDAALEVMGRCWTDPRTLEFMRGVIAKEEPALRRAALLSVAREWAGHAEVGLLLQRSAVDDAAPEVRQAAMKALARWSGCGAAQWASFRVTAVADPDGGVRELALELLARDCPEQPATTALVRDRAVNDDDERVRATALQAAVALCEHDGSLVDLLVERVAEDPSAPVKEVAMNALLRLPIDPLRLRDLLQAIATGSYPDVVRRVAVQRLARAHGNDATARTTLLQLASRGVEGPRLRRTVLRELARACPDDARTNALLCAVLRETEDWSVRRTALQELAAGWPGTAETLQLVSDRAANDAHPGVRQTAAQLLARVGGRSSQVDELLLDLSASDVSPQVRSTALRELARRGDSLDLREFLALRAKEDKDADVRAVAQQEIARQAREPVRELGAGIERERVVEPRP